MSKQYVILKDDIDMSGYKVGDIIERDPLTPKQNNKFRKVDGSAVSGPFIGIDAAVRRGKAREIVPTKAPKVPKAPKVSKAVEDYVQRVFESLREGERCHMVNKLHKEGYLGTGPLASKGDK